MISTNRPVYFSGWLKDELSVQYEDVLPILHLPVICIRKSSLCGHIASCIRLEFPVVDPQENRRGIEGTASRNAWAPPFAFVQYVTKHWVNMYTLPAAHQRVKGGMVGQAGS